MRKLVIGLAVGALMFGVAMTASASTINVQNSSFEIHNGVLNLSGNYSYPLYWDTTGRSGRQEGLGPEFEDGFVKGSAVAFVNIGYLFQDTGVSIQGGHTYYLSVDVGFRSDLPDYGITSPFPGATIQLLAGGDVLGSASLEAGALDHGQYDNLLLTFKNYPSLNYSGTLGIKLTSGGVQANFDNVQLTQASHTPEPATLLLFGSGLVGLAGLGRKKMKK